MGEAVPVGEVAPVEEEGGRICMVASSLLLSSSSIWAQMVFNTQLLLTFSYPMWIGCC